MGFVFAHYLLHIGPQRAVRNKEMEREEQKRLLEEVFGESSSSSSSSDSDHQLQPSSSPSNPINPNPSWARIEPITGLWICPDFLSPARQFSLLSSLQNEGWFSDALHNQAMRFGDLPHWAVELSDQIHEAVCTGNDEIDRELFSADNGVCILPSHLLWRDPFHDQLIINVYQPGEGICAHVDLMRFEDGIAIVSLESPCVMHFSPVERNGIEVSLNQKIPVYLTPGSLVIMWGDARYNWKHEINWKPGFQVWQGREIEQNRRTSITLRKLCILE